MDQQPTATSRRFVICFCGSFLLMLLGTVAVHVLGNPDDMFPSPRVPNRQDRGWKSRRLMSLLREGKPPQAVILGSSRMKQVSPKHIHAISGLRTFNYAVGGATPTESLAQVKSMLRAGIKPKLIIL